MVSIIVAKAQNGVIGKDNGLIWHITEDMKYFKATTSSHTVIMGRKSYESIGFPLPNRRNIVLSRNKNFSAPGCEVVRSIESALELCSGDEQVFIIGGEQIYNISLNLASRLYITEIEGCFEGDAYFPEFDKTKYKEVKRERFERGSKFNLPFSFVIYDKI